MYRCLHYFRFQSSGREVVHAKSIMTSNSEFGSIL